MELKDHYAALEVQRDATERDIKSAFRRLAKVFHPDKNRGDLESERRFKEIAAAYEVLADPQRRRDYDLSREGWGSPGMDRYGGFSAFGGRRGCGRGHGCRGKWGGFGRMAGFVEPCVVELTPEEARRGTEKRCVMDSSYGRVAFSIAIPPGTKDGTVYRVEGPLNDILVAALDVQIKIC
ncbi:MAG: DnaJ domain-containing protein [Spirochaetes bacterium]|nr:DnaJ domain-containing protein [Spirochaetota bacterium]